MNHRAVLLRLCGLPWVVLSVAIPVALPADDPTTPSSPAVRTGDSSAADEHERLSPEQFASAVNLAMREGGIDGDVFARVLDFLQTPEEAPGEPGGPLEETMQQFRRKFAAQQAVYGDVWTKWKAGTANVKPAEIALAATRLAVARARMDFARGGYASALLYQRVACVSAEQAVHEIGAAYPSHTAPPELRYWEESGLQSVRRSLLYFERHYAEPPVPYLDRLAAEAGSAEELLLPLHAIPNPRTDSRVNSLGLLIPNSPETAEAPNSPDMAAPAERTEPPEIHQTPEPPESLTMTAEAWQTQLAEESGLPAKFANSIGLELALIPPVEGEESTRPEQSRQPFYLGTHEVSVQQFARFVEESAYQTDAERQGHLRTWRVPGFQQTKDHPVVRVTWNDAAAFCDWLSRREGKTYRLPAETEWEYACRALTATLFHFGDSCEGTKANCDSRGTNGSAGQGQYVGQTAPVGSYDPNSWGLYDMHGNVWEWCRDRVPGSGDCRIVRGGSWDYDPDSARSSARLNNLANRALDNTGFRVLLVDLSESATSATTVPSPHETP